MSDPIAFPAIDATVILQLIIVFGWSIVLLVIDLFIARDNKRLTGYLALLGIVVAAVAGIPFWNTNNGVTFSNMIVLDNYALVLNWIFLLSAAITIVISLDYLPHQGIERGEYYVLLLMATGGMMLLAQGIDLIAGCLDDQLLLLINLRHAFPGVDRSDAADDVDAGRQSRGHQLLRERGGVEVGGRGAEGENKITHTALFSLYNRQKT